MASQQRSLFDQPLWEQDDRRSVNVAEIVFATGVEGIFDYVVPPPLANDLVPGQRVLVPFGRANATREGYCVGLATRETDVGRLKAVLKVLDRLPLLSPAMLRLTQHMAEYYLTHWGSVLEAAVPTGVRAQAGTRIVKRAELTAEGRHCSTDALPPKQAAVLHALRQSQSGLTVGDLQVSAACTAGPIQTLAKKRLIQIVSDRVAVGSSARSQPATPAHLQLNAMQQLAVDSVVSALQAGRHEIFLLHGVTGSGKTEVYIRSIEEVIRYRRQAIVLVPEISLTPQTEQRFRSRFPEVAVLHSHLSDGERNAHWQRIARGDVQVIVGARSAIFAPAQHLGLIIIDEEHEASFKQDTAPRYHARDVARWRAQNESIPLVLGSATPSLEAWQLSNCQAATLLSMPHRILNLPLPDVVIIDTRLEARERLAKGAMSPRLVQAVKQALLADEQIILLLNRRGYSTHIQCPACGYVARCPHCDIPLTHHRDGERALCHYCDFQMPAPPRCPDCRFEGIHYFGLGTQKLEAEAKARFPNAQILRMDSDTMRRAGSHEASLDQFRRGDVQILVGTQMIAKGLDFPNVTVVGVISADSALHLPDFRAAERTFQLVTQVAGRTGRGPKGGRVFVQTHQPDHPAILAAERHDYLRFARDELPLRAAFGYPPFGKMIRLIVRGPQLPWVQQIAQELARRVLALQTDLPDLRVLGPAPAPLMKHRDQFRYHVLVRATDLDTVKTVLRDAQATLKLPEDTRWQADVDPLDML